MVPCKRACEFSIASSDTLESSNAQDDSDCRSAFYLLLYCRSHNALQSQTPRDVSLLMTWMQMTKRILAVSMMGMMMMMMRRTQSQISEMECELLLPQRYDLHHKLVMLL